MKEFLKFIRNLKGYWKLQKDYGYDPDTYAFIIENYQEVLCSCTHLMSKPTYYARDVISEIDRYYNEDIDEAIQDTKNQIIDYCKGEMMLDNNGNNPLSGGTEEYEQKHSYQIGHNTALEYVIRELRK